MFDAVNEVGLRSMFLTTLEDFRRRETEPGARFQASDSDTF
jgi:hypothetical protein